MTFTCWSCFMTFHLTEVKLFRGICYQITKEWGFLCQIDDFTWENLLVKIVLRNWFRKKCIFFKSNRKRNRIGKISREPMKIDKYQQNFSWISSDFRRSIHFSIYSIFNRQKEWLINKKNNYQYLCHLSRVDLLTIDRVNYTKKLFEQFLLKIQILNKTYLNFSITTTCWAIPIAYGI